MLDEQTPADNAGENQNDSSSTEPAPVAEASATRAPAKRAPRKAATKATARAASAEAGESGEAPAAPPPLKKAPAKRAPRKSTAKKATEPPAEESAPPPVDVAVDAPAAEAPAAEAPAKKAPAKRASRARKVADAAPDAAPADAMGAVDSVVDAPAEAPVPALLFQAPDPVPAKRAPRKRAPAKKTVAPEVETPEEADDLEPLGSPTGADATDGQRAEDAAAAPSGSDEPDDGAGGAEIQADNEADSEVDSEVDDDEDEDDASGDGGPRRRRRRGGRRRRKGSGGGNGAEADVDPTGNAPDGSSDAEDTNAAGGPTKDDDADQEAGEKSSSRRRRRRRRSGEGDEESSDSSGNGGNGGGGRGGNGARARKPRNAEDEITGFSGSTRLEAKKQRRREGREAGRRRAPIISEAEFLARREAVDRTMVIRQRDDLTQIAVLEDKVLVEHYVARESQTSLIGNVYLGKVQNVLPSMEAAFIDIGKGRNAVLYAGEVNWALLGAKDGQQRKIEQVLKPGQPILVQVSKDPIGHKGARLTSQISLPGRFLVYVPDGTTSGISRKLPENERHRLKTLLKEIVPDTARVIVRTAAEGASEDELTRDVERLKALWEDISARIESTKGGTGGGAQLLYGEPDLTVKVVRDLFTEDFASLVISGEQAWDEVQGYVTQVAPDLADRLERHEDSEREVFAAYRIDEQIAKGLDRKVWLPSGGSLVIDRTEAMTVVDVNTGKFTGSGGNLEETVTKNNLEAAEEIVRQLRLRDIGGIIVVDFIDMVLESNRDLVLRRLIECLGRDRTRHQVAEVTSLGLVQMTRKRIGTGLLEAFSESCEHCQGRGLVVHAEPVESKRRPAQEEEPRRGRRGRGRGPEEEDAAAVPEAPRRPTPAEFAAMARSEAAAAASAADDAEAAAGAANHLVSEADEADEVDEVMELDRLPEPEPEPAVLEVDPAAEPEPAAPPVLVTPPAPTGPRLVTRVRKTGARRAAGPPPPAPVEEDGAHEDGAHEDGVPEDGLPGVDAPGHAADAAVHVPVKGSRSRRR